jgi:flavin-dependent dehydrogenase
MTASRIRSVAVIGDGPAGTTLASYLARAGVRVALFARGRPPLVVGESLVPAVIPFLRELGVEDEVRSYAVHKPGATFVVRDGDALAIRFDETCTKIPGYAYNVPRDRFDATLLATCIRSGAHLIETAGRVERAGDGREVRLAPDSRDAAADALGGEPDLIVDAAGRTRLLARLLELPTQAGERRDTALFAHCEGVPLDHAGHVHSDRLEHGWCWRIPLRGRVSLGIVVDPDILRRFGSDAETQYDAFLRAEPRLKRLVEGCRRLTPVMKYSNYQLKTLRGAGPGWALAGDSFGFIDPVFSSGLYLAMDGARTLASAIRSGTRAAFRHYERHHLRHLAAWHRAAGYFYDGRFFALLRLRDERAGHWIGRAIHAHVSRHAPQIFTGEGTTHRYSRWLLDLVAEHTLREPERAEPHIA